MNGMSGMMASLLQSMGVDQESMKATAIALHQRLQLLEGAVGRIDAVLQAVYPTEHAVATAGQTVQPVQPSTVPQVVLQDPTGGKGYTTGLTPQGGS